MTSLLPHLEGLERRYAAAAHGGVVYELAAFRRDARIGIDVVAVATAGNDEGSTR